MLTHAGPASTATGPELARSVTRRKVVRIVTRLNVGGPAIHTILLTALMDSSRYETVLVSGSEGPSEGSMRYLAAEWGIAVETIPEIGREITWRDDFMALLRLIEVFRRERPEIIDTHTAKAGTLGRIAAIISSPWLAARLYHTFHGHVFHGYFGPLKTAAFIWIERLLARFTHRIIAVSEQTRDDLVRLRIAPPEKIVCVPLGLDLDRFASCEEHAGELRQELGISNRTPLVGIVARLVPIKAIDRFLEAAARVVETVPDAIFLVVGDGELRADLEKVARDLGLSGKVRFLGFRQDIARIYADLDLVVLTSKNEGLPVSLIEAMAARRVAVGTSVGGVPELLRDGETGYLVQPDDPDALASVICKALADPDREQVGARAREFSLARFHVSRLVTDMERLYSEQ